jgi:hypothetical protein
LAEDRSGSGTLVLVSILEVEDVGGRRDLRSGEKKESLERCSDARMSGPDGQDKK